MYKAWTFDDGAGETYTVPINPNKMGKLKAARAITTRTTTAFDGRAVFFEGQRPPQSWNFAGTILHKDHLDALDHWVYDKGRITITDHLNRAIYCVLEDFDAQLKRAINRPYKHEYTVTGLVISVNDTAAVEDPPEPPPVQYTGTGNQGGLLVAGYAGTATGGQPAQIYHFNALAVWDITHTLNHRPVVEIIDAAGDQVFPSITYPDDTHVRVTFTVPTTGYAILA